MSASTESPGTGRVEFRQAGRGRVERLRGYARGHRVFLIALTAGLVLRVLAQVAYWPVLLFEDSYFYLDNTDEFDPGDLRPVGYSIFLRGLLALPDLAFVPIVQHLMGLGMGVLIYAFLLRWGVRRWLAAVAAIPVLCDGYQLQIEHHVMSDTLFQAMVLGALALLAWRRPTVPVAAVAGLILGLSVWVRLVGQPLVIPAVLVVLLAAVGWRRKVAGTLVLALTFTAPVFGYLAWYNHLYGEYQFSDIGARVQYARVGRFVDCDQLPIPDHQRPLCPDKPADQRLPPNAFVWSPESPARQYEPPPGMDKDAVIRDFARTAITHQPGAFLAAWMHDFSRGFYPVRTTQPPEVPVWFWHFPTEWRTWGGDRHVPTTAREYGSSTAFVNENLARGLRWYQLSVGQTPGTLLGVALVVGTAGAAGVGRARRSGLRTVCFLYASAGGGLLLAAATFEFSWRYQLPGLVLLPVAGALGLTALRHGDDGGGPGATPAHADHDTTRSTLARVAR